MEAGEMQSLLEELRHTVRRTILSRYKTIDAFAIDAGMDQSTVSRFLSGDRKPQLVTFLQIASTLDMDLGPLFPFGRSWSVAEKKQMYFPDAKPRRRRMTVLLSETSVIEIKRDERQDKPVLELKLS